MTFEQSYDILNNKLGLLVDVSKPLAPQLKQARIDRMQGKTEEPDVLKYAEADRKILAEMRRALREGKPPPWYNEVDRTKPLAPQVQAFNEQQAAKERACKQQQEQDGIENDWADSGDSG